MPAWGWGVCQYRIDLDKCVPFQTSGISKTSELPTGNTDVGIGASEQYKVMLFQDSKHPLGKKEVRSWRCPTGSWFSTV